MTREETILTHIRRDGLGLEIGADCSPIAPKKRGFRVHVLDCCDKEALIEKYRPHGIAVENIEEADFVWDGRPYTELIGRRHVYDWIIASHVPEYTTDLIGFLNDCDSLLKKMASFRWRFPTSVILSITFARLLGSGASSMPREIHRRFIQRDRQRSIS